MQPRPHLLQLLRARGVFDVPRMLFDHGGSGGSFSLSSWNSRAFLHHDEHLRATKYAILHKLLLQSGHLLVQEAHGSISDHRRLEHRFSRTHFVAHSACGDGASGGVLSFRAKASFPLDTAWQCEVIAPGRIICTHIRSPLGHVQIFDIHNYDVSAVQLQALARSVKSSYEKSRKSNFKHFTFLGGDFIYYLNLNSP